MSQISPESLTERQRRELEYHRHHAALVGQSRAVSYRVIESKERWWWNAYWDIWTTILKYPMRGKKVLVVGCGGGEDAFLFAKLGAEVSAFDLSPDMLAIAIERAKAAGLPIRFEQMPAEKTVYADGSFDIVFARDILHHVDIPATMREIVRVSKPDAVLFVDEIYSHSITDVIRKSWLVQRVLYPRLQGFIYKDGPVYITKDERKMTQKDIREVERHLSGVDRKKYFNFLVTRIVPDNYKALNKLDRILLMLLGPLGYFCAGRISFTGAIRREA